MRTAPPTADADLGVTTIAGKSVGVVTRGEVRSLPVYGPGGYVWMPRNGAEVLIIKGGPGGEEQSVAGMLQESIPAGMQPGEVYLHSAGGSSIYLRQNGTVEITGELVVNGESYRPCTCSKEGL
jgi:phage gp45-like